jgi:glyoxylase-like metal-dependent hydrolase (beta-lactamase superfamily II)
MEFAGWREVGDRIFVRRHTSYDLNVGLVVGTDACLVIDTRESRSAGRDLADAIRTITPAAWTVVNTHAHFDHYLGNAAFVPAPIWALDLCKERIVASGPSQLETFGDGDTPLAPPTDTFAPPAHDLDIGGRTVTLRHLGRGHTDNDIIVGVDEVIFAGDLVEEGAPPSFDDAYPAEWPTTIDALLPLCNGPVVPGHGDVVDAAFVRDQQALLRSVAQFSREEAAQALRGLLG